MKLYWLPTLILTTLIGPFIPKALAFDSEPIVQLPLSEPFEFSASVDSWNDGQQGQWEDEWESDLAFADVDQFVEENDSSVASFDDWQQGQDLDKLANELTFIEVDPLAKGLSSPVDDLEPLEGKWAEDLDNADVSLEKGFIRIGSRRNRSRHGRLRRRRHGRQDIFFSNGGRRRGRYRHGSSRRRGRLDFDDIFFRHDSFRHGRRRRHDQWRHDDFRNDQFRHNDGRRRRY